MGRKLFHCLFDSLTRALHLSCWKVHRALVILEPVETDVESLRSLVSLNPAAGARSSRHSGKSGQTSRNRNICEAYINIDLVNRFHLFLLAVLLYSL